MVLCIGLVMFSTASARTTLDAGNPVRFFSTVADKLLRNTFSFGITNIPVSTNGVFVYTPSVQRLLQLSANIYDAANTNFYPTVFRPLFFNDGSGNIFITGYRRVIGVTGAGDAQLAAPIDISAVPVGSSTNLNVYGVPWIIGAKKGLPNFNEFYMRNAFQLTRKLQVTRVNGSLAGATATNEMFIMSITNRLGFSFWNSYNANYAGGNNLTVFASDTVLMTLMNGVATWSAITNVAFNINLSSWSGAAWNADGVAEPEAQSAATQSFVTATYDYPFLPESVYVFSTASFNPISQGIQWETSIPYPPVFPQFGLMTTNWLQAFILDGTNIVDYVQFSGPNSSRNLNNEVNDPDTVGSPYYMWSTNAFGLNNLNNTPTWGVANQIAVSRNPFLISLTSWPSQSDIPAIFNTVALQAQYFSAFFSGAAVIVAGKTYHNTNLVMEVPYTPTRTAWQLTIWQANDPLVHYLASDLNVLNDFVGLARSDDLITSPMPDVALTDINSSENRYQPWGRNLQMSTLDPFAVDTDEFNSRLRDPLVWNSDAWNFPNGQGLPLTTLGRIHRGTPWQTFYLKQRDVLQEIYSSGPIYAYVGTNTWMQWTGDLDPNDATLTAPISDWQLLDVLLPLLNTNDPTQLISVNDTSVNDWSNLLNGISVLTNSTAFVADYIIPELDPITMTGGSSQAGIISTGIAQTKANQPGQFFSSVGEILQTATLTEQSLWLDVNDANEQTYGISDEAYEAVPSQLLPLLRTDSFGAVVQTNGTWNIQFSGSDSYVYALQTSTDLVHWSFVSTNCPVQGTFAVPVASPADTQNAHFYRSVLLP